MKTITVIATWSSELEVEVEDDYVFTNGDLGSGIADVVRQDTATVDLDLIDWEVVGSD